MENELFDDQDIWKKYTPVPNPWFSNKFIYEGWGKATFENPVGTIEGTTKVTVSEDGKLDVIMEMEYLETKEQVLGNGSFRIHKFLTGNVGANNEIIIETSDKNPCSSLTVQTHEGKFSTYGKVFHSVGWALDDKITFLVTGGIYKLETLEKPEYWVIPLTNFITNYPFNYHPLLVQHPLRLFKTPMVPDMPDKEQMSKALLVANKTNTLIDFNFEDKVGFIQPTLDCYEKEEKIKAGDLRQGITALMISEIIPEMDDEWFPDDYTNLLSLAIGNLVECPWIELRDKSGGLVSRKHIPTRRESYIKGYAVINDYKPSGIGQLLTDASSSSDFKKDYYHVLIGHLVRLQSFGYQIEDHMDLLCRTYDTLGEEFNLGTQKLMNGLSVEEKTEISAIIKEAVKKMNILLEKAPTSSKDRIQRIRERIGNANNKDRAFGLTVMELLKKFDLYDRQIMEKCYFQHLEEREKTWAEKLSEYRGTVIHTGYFPGRNGLYNFDEILQMENHLHDMLVRIALKILNFEGNYQPRVIRHLVTDKTVNWVTETTPAEELGYGRLER